MSNFNWSWAFLGWSLLSGCVDDLTGFPGVSKNIQDAKSRGVFIVEYTTFPNPYKVNDTMWISVKEAWLERQWRYKKDLDSAKIDSGYQLCINTDEKDIIGENLTWLIGSYHSYYLRMSSNNSLIGDFDTKPSDTIIYKVQKGKSLAHDSYNETLGNFVLIRKN